MNKIHKYTMLLFFLTLFVCCSYDSIQAAAYSYSSSHESSNLLINGKPVQGTEGWTNTGSSLIYKYTDGIGKLACSGTSDNLAAYQYVYLNQDDIARANLGQLKVRGEGMFWQQASSKMKASITVNFYSSGGSYLGQGKVSYDKYTVGGGYRSLSFDYVIVPAGTTNMKVSISNDNSLAGRPSVYDIGVYLKDETAPVYIVTAPITTPNKYKKGTTIRYQIQFTEPVNVTSSGYLKFKVGTQAFDTNSVYAGQSSDKTTLYYDFTLPDTTTLGDNLAVSVTGISGLTVSDDALNSISAAQTLNLSNGFYVDNKAPEVSGITTSGSNAVYKAGEILTFDVTFHENIWVDGAPVITLSNNKNATYIKRTTTDTTIASFEYLITPGDDVINIEIASINFSGIRDSVSNHATESKTYDTNAYNSFMSNKYVSVDTTAPTTTFSTQPEGWQKTFEVLLTPADNIAGVEEIYAAWTSGTNLPQYPYAANVDITTKRVASPVNTGIYNLHIKLVDSVGNTATYSSPYTYYVDCDVPLITASATITEDTNIVISVTASASDNHSGMESLTYKWINGNDATVLEGAVGDGISIPQSDGVYKIVITANDKVSNTDTKTIENLQVDSIAPLVQLTPLDGEAYQKSYTVNVGVADEKSGVDKYYYIWNTTAQKPDAGSSEWNETASNTLKTLDGVSGTYYLHIKAIDKVGNIEVASSGGFNLDNDAPTVQIIPDGNANSLGETSCDVAFNISDSYSTNDELVIKYAVSESETFPESLSDLSGSSITVDTTSTVKYIHIKATDVAGNEKLFTSNAFIPDTVAPVGTIEKESDVYYVNNNNVSVNIGADDNYSSAVYMQFSIDGEEEEWESLYSKKTLSFDAEEKEHVISVRFRDKSGNISEYSTVKYYYDVTKPEIELSYSTDKATNGSVTVKATANDNASTVNFITESEKTFDLNGSFEFAVSDEAGNVANVTATVNYIDKINPVIVFESTQFDSKKHKNATVKVSADDANGIAEVQYAVVKTGDEAGSYIACQNGEEINIKDLDGTYEVWVKATDSVGNTEYRKSQSLLFDNTVPEPSVSYEPSSRTARDVLATISFNEEAEVTNNNLSNKYLFNANGSFSFEFRDEAGNTGSCMASVDWIDRSQPTAKVQLSAEDWTNEDLTVILLPQPNSIIRNVRFNDAPIEEDEFNTYVFGEYGILTYEIYDIQTEIAFEDAVTIKVDKALPMVTSTQYSTESWTNNSVTVTVTANDNLSGVVYKNASTHVFDENGTFTFVIADGAGNEITNTVTVDWIDKSVPIPTVSYFVESNPYDLSSPTNKNVTAVVTFDEGGSPVSITNNEGSAEYVFDINGSFEIMFKDEAGNVGSVTANVSKIDKVAPTGYITYSEAGWTNNDIIATLHTADDVNDVIITNNSGNDCTFTENGEFTFEFKDIAGNTSSVTAVTSRIDKKKPVLSYTLSNEDVTAFSVYVFLTADEEVTITNNSGKTSRQFNSNGEFTFTAKDRAGNTSELTVVVSNISKETTPVKLTYSETNPTNDDVFVTIEPQDGKSYIYLLNNGGQKIRKFSENGEFTFKYKNAAGIEGEAVASVTNIDKVPPLLSVEYSHNIMTSDNVTATFKSDEAVVYPYLIVDNKYIFTENNKIQFPVKDLVGNISNIVVETKLIDKTAPEIKMQNQYCILELGSTFDPLEGTEVSDNNELDGEMVVSGAVDTNQVGDYTITYIAKDKAGNTTEAYKYVTVYDPNTFNVFINGRLSTVSQINSASRNIKIQTINAGGNVLAKILTGKKSVGDFKTKGNIIPLDGEFPSTGYYTIYIRDDERNSRIVYVFIEE